jgi:hypothetical protein
MGETMGDDESAAGIRASDADAMRPSTGSA